MDRQEIIASLSEVGSGTVDKALKGLLAEKEVYRQVGASNKHLYSLSSYEEVQSSFMV